MHISHTGLHFLVRVLCLVMSHVLSGALMMTAMMPPRELVATQARAQRTYEYFCQPYQCSATRMRMIGIGAGAGAHADAGHVADVLVFRRSSAAPSVRPASSFRWLLARWPFERTASVTFLDLCCSHCPCLLLSIWTAASFAICLLSAHSEQRERSSGAGTMWSTLAFAPPRVRAHMLIACGTKVPRSRECPPLPRVPSGAQTSADR